MPLSPPQTSPAVSLEKVSRLYGNFAALRGVSITLPAGSSVVLLGANGAGKSTLLKLLAGLMRPTQGTVRVFGEDPAAPALRGRVAYMGHHTMLYDELTGPENLRYLLPLQRPSMNKDEVGQRVAEGLEAVGLNPKDTRRVGEYSQGMRQRASLARVLLAEPSLLLLDEPFSNLDVDSAHAMVERLRRWLDGAPVNAARRTVLLTTHQAHLAEPLANTVLTLHNGTVTEERRKADRSKVEVVDHLDAVKQVQV